MPDDGTIENVTQEEITELLECLAQLRNRLAAARATLAPLEEGLNTAHLEYQNALGQLRRRLAPLQAEVDELRHKIENAEPASDDFDAFIDVAAPTNADLTLSSTVKELPADMEAREKDELLEHLHWVLDPMINDEDGELIADLQSRFNDPATRLADMLEKLPWGPAWTAPSPREEPINQYRRLKTWERALTEPPRDSRRLQFLRGWSHENNNEIFAGVS
jgi:DNA repair exonuclease SbcCD ATPase subunit